ncbi:MAG: hypothetical protein J0M08_10045 [Bacteroidetes bacterium]|nr:hypothetical protein [Bacteroidota bacterium]
MKFVCGFSREQFFKEYELATNKALVNTAQLVNGFYWVTVKTSSDVLTRKILVAH